MKTKLCLLAAVGLIAGAQTNFAADDGLSKLAAADNTFAFKLIRQISAAQPGQNIFISPYSAATALQMALNGAAGQTRAEMQTVLETSGISTGTMDEAVRNLALILKSTDKHLVLNTANSLWYRQSAAVKPIFKTLNQNYFSSSIKELDFGNASAAEAKINQWASNQTHGRITGIADGMVTPETDLILANAIYFKGKWQDPFEANLTKERPFHSSAGADKNVPMMEMSKKFDYLRGPDYQGVRLPYMGGNLAMYVFLPDSGSSPEKLLKALNGDNWQQEIMQEFDENKGRLVLPKFKMENTLELKQPLKALGINTAFDGKQADFSGIFIEPHHISEIRQKAFVEVNEEGTEAAAATGVAVTALAAMRSEPFEMIVDRPFMFTIVDARSEMILFMGVVNAP